jgi:hypothetical protein
MQNLYLDHPVDVELSYDDNNVLKKPASDIANDGGATSVKHIAPNLIDSNLLGQAHPLVVDWVEATAPLAGGQKRKRPRLPLSASSPNLQPIM